MRFYCLTMQHNSYTAMSEYGAISAIASFSTGLSRIYLFTYLFFMTFDISFKWLV